MQRVRSISFLSLLFVLLFVTAQGLGAVLPCEVLKERIDAQLQAKGVASYSLTIVPIGADETGKRVGTCNGGTAKILYVRHAVATTGGRVSPLTTNQELRINVDWPFSQASTPCGDCGVANSRPPCCATCTPPGNGLLARKQIAAQSAIAARNGACEGAVALFLQTQCHNPHVIELIASHHTEVCDLLKQH
jgi:hypothetical protein